MAAQVYLTYSELPVDPPTERELDEIVSSFKRKPTFFMIAMLNMFLALFDANTDEQQAIKVQRFLMANLLDDELYRLVDQKLEEESLIERPVFHRQQLLALMKKVLLEASEDGEIDPNQNDEAKYQLGKACLSMSDFLVSPDQNEMITVQNPAEDHDRVLTELLVQWSPPAELMNPPNPIHSIARGSEYFGILDQGSSEFKLSGGKSLATVFKGLTQLTLQQHLKMIYCIHTWYATREFSELVENPASFNINKKTYFSTLGMRESEVESFFHLNAISVDQLITELSRPPTGTPLRPQYDFTVFRKYPLVDLSEGIITCIDISFLIEKLAAGIYHTILNSLPQVGNDRNLFSNYWGVTFQTYVNDLLREVYPPESGRFFDLPYFDRARSKYEAFDGVIDCGDAIIVMEYKGGYLHAAAKYSGTSNIFLADLNKKFGRGRHAGLEQLGRKLEIIFNAVADARKTFSNISFQHVKIIYPLLVVQEPFLRNGLANWKMNRLFQDEIKNRNLDPSLTIRPLVTLTIEDLERVLPYIGSGDISFISLLEDYTTAEYAPHIAFLDVLNLYRQNNQIPHHQNELMWERFQKVHNEIKESINKEHIS